MRREAAGFNILKSDLVYHVSVHSQTRKLYLFRPWAHCESRARLSNANPPDKNNICDFGVLLNALASRMASHDGGTQVHAQAVLLLGGGGVARAWLALALLPGLEGRQAGLDLRRTAGSEEQQAPPSDVCLRARFMAAEAEGGLPERK